MKKIAILTSGGDAPGMNAAIRALVREGIKSNLKVYGIQDGLKGLYSKDQYKLMSSKDVGGIIQLGGTALGSSRCPEFLKHEGRAKALENLYRYGIEALIIIGGNGSQAASYELHKLGLPVLGIASTIDNDLMGSEICIGFDTALNTALESIDRLKVTASSHHRVTIVEVMGRDCGHLALMAGIAGGAEAIFIPELDLDPNEVAMKIPGFYKSGKQHVLIVVAEGAKYNARNLQQFFLDHYGHYLLDIRMTILGHVQRGGTPTFLDRFLGTRLGMAAIDFLLKGEVGNLVGIKNSKIQVTPLKDVVGKIKSPPQHLLEMAKSLF